MHCGVGVALTRAPALCAKLRAAMQRHPDDRRRASLLPAGRRWGFGAHSVLPYLAPGRQQRGSVPQESEPSVSNPVFLHMDQTLRALRRS